MTTTRAPGPAQRRTFTLTAAAATAIAGAGALLGRGDPLPVTALTAAAVLSVVLRPRGDTPLLAFLLIVVAWAVFVPQPTLWAVLAAAALLVAHASLAVADSTQGRAVLPRPALVRLARRCVIVAAITCAAAPLTLARHTPHEATHTAAGVAGCLLLAGWISLLRTRDLPGPDKRLGLAWPHTRRPVRHPGQASSPRTESAPGPR